MLQNKFILKTGKNSEIKWIYYVLLNSEYMKNVTCVQVPHIAICKYQFRRKHVLPTQQTDFVP